MTITQHEIEPNQIKRVGVTKNNGVGQNYNYLDSAVGITIIQHETEPNQTKQVSVTKNSGFGQNCLNPFIY